MNNLLDLIRIQEGYQDTNLPPPRRKSKSGPYYWTQSSHAEDGGIPIQSLNQRDRTDRYRSMGTGVEVTMAMIFQLRMRRRIGKGERFRFQVTVHVELFKPTTFR